MKKNELTKVVLAVLVFASSAAMAESDYPAADFQPKVIYSDDSAPQNASSSEAKAAPAAEVDENFPATNYQPKVLFSDAEYKHSSEAPSVKSSSASSSRPATSASAAVEVIQSEKEASSDFSYIGLIVIALAGFFVYSKKTGGSGVSKSSKKSVPENNYVASADGATGVEKYLEKVGINKTGVAKYLEKQVETYPSTGVAKYMAKQIVKDRAVAASKVTGVEKYLRDKV